VLHGLLNPWRAPEGKEDHPKKHTSNLKQITTIHPNDLDLLKKYDEI